ncbi:MAG: GNAT family N-acetyltransferase [Mariniblastus sp.]
MIEYRSFLNTDSPWIVDIWRQQPAFRGQISNINRTLLDHQVFGKPYFDSRGLIMAVLQEDNRTTPLGFVHAGFAANSELSDLHHGTGVVSVLKVVPGERQEEIADQLLDRALQYLGEAGATRVHFGSYFPFAPFYMGLYGGSQIPGLLVDDKLAVSAAQRRGFEVDDKIIVMERRLTGFRTFVDREQMSLRRRYQINAVADPMESSWWESCTLGMAERDRFSVYDKANQNVCGSVQFWDMQPLASGYGVMARGMHDLNVPEELRRGGIATFLVGEALRHLMQQGVGLVEAQTRESDQPAIGVFRKLGFEEVGQGLLMSRPVA